MAVRTRRLAGPTYLTVATDVLIYTVPADRTAIIKDVVFTNSSATDTPAELGIGGTGNGKTIWKTSVVGASSGVAQLRYLVLQEGELLYAKAGTGNRLTVSCHGVQLLGDSA